jgi:hypothetical protein
MPWKECSVICLRRKQINFSTVFAGQAVGIKEVEEGIWLVKLYGLRSWIHRSGEKTLQALENPFGPKV